MMERLLHRWLRCEGGRRPAPALAHAGYDAGVADASPSSSFVKPAPSGMSIAEMAAHTTDDMKKWIQDHAFIANIVSDDWGKLGLEKLTEVIFAIRTNILPVWKKS